MGWYFQDVFLSFSAVYTARIGILQEGNGFSRVCLQVSLSVHRGGDRHTRPQSPLHNLVQSIRFPPDMFKLINLVVRTVGKRLVGVRLKCFLVFIICFESAESLNNTL